MEGDLRERIGLPVHEGDTLFKLARIDRLYARRRSVRGISASWRMRGEVEIALTARPQEKLSDHRDPHRAGGGHEEYGKHLHRGLQLPDGPRELVAPGDDRSGKARCGNQGTPLGPDAPHGGLPAAAPVVVGGRHGSGSRGAQDLP